MNRSEFETLAGQIKTLMKRRGFTQQELADLAKIHRITLSNFFRGVHTPDTTTVMSIVKALKLTDTEMANLRTYLPIDDQGLARLERSRRHVEAADANIALREMTERFLVSEKEARNLRDELAQKKRAIENLEEEFDSAAGVIQLLKEKNAIITAQPTGEDAELLYAYKTAKPDTREKVRFLLGLSQSDATEDETLQSERSLHPTKSSKPKSDK